MDSTRPVVAGVDGSTTSERALSWAAHAAAQRGMPFEIVHAWQMPVLGELPDPVVLDPIPYERDAREVLDGAVAHIRQLMPVLLVQPRLVRGEAAGALLEAASTASVLVLGSHGRGWIGSALVGSVLSGRRPRPRRFHRAVTRIGESPLRAQHAVPDRRRARRELVTFDREDGG
jgi:nucleotide-binding universal stress UspA family protein